MSNNYKFRLGRRFARYIEMPRLRGTVRARIYEYLERSYHNIGSQLEFYGELDIIGKLSKFALNTVILDVGANHGQYALRWVGATRNARVISFEIDPKLQPGLRAAAAPYGGRWLVEDFGLSDRNGGALLYKSDRSDEVTSLEAVVGSELSQETSAS